jgi:membrane protease YdiL (CAAX protease family)
MKKEIKIAIVVLIGFLSFLWLEKPLREYLTLTLFEEKIAKQISSITIRIILIAITFGLIKKLRLIDFTGLNYWQNLKNIQAVMIVLAFIIIGISGNWTTYKGTKLELLILFALSTFAVGIVEELAFRGTIFPLLIKSFKKTNRPILISALLSSLMFGLVHFINLFSQPENIIGIISQVFFATAIGVFFCGLMVRTENILIPCIIHALVNFSFGAGELKQSIKEISDIEEVSVINWNSLIPTTIFFSFIFIGGIYMILKTDKEAILDSLKQNTATIKSYNGNTH